MNKKYYACVYGGAGEKISDTLKTQVQTLGNIIADNGFSLVYGAGANGIMGAVARGVKEKGGYVLGTAPSFIGPFESLFPCDEFVPADNMSVRKDFMEEKADLFIIAPGGIGTLDEFFQVLTLKYLKRHSAPIVILNLEGFYDSLIALIDDLVSKNTVIEDIHSLFDVAESVHDPVFVTHFNNIKGGAESD